MTRKATRSGGTAGLAVRAATALLGGYAAAAALSTLAARLLPIARVEATVWAMLLSFALYAALGLWAFHEPRLGRVAAILWGGALFAAGAVLLLGMRP